jgi:hypothetical protein
MKGDKGAASDKFITCSQRQWLTFDPCIIKKILTSSAMKGDQQQLDKHYLFPKTMAYVRPIITKEPDIIG